MSKTTKTRPYNVRLFDKKDKNFKMRIEHNHEEGECDLSEPNFEANHEGQQGKRCRYVFEYAGVNICACISCGDKRRYNNLKSSVRRETHVQIKRLEKLYNNGENLEELDESSLEKYHSPNLTWK